MLDRLRRAGARDAPLCLALVAGALALYAATLLPGLGGGDTAEFQRVLPTLGVAHPTGYPLYTMLGWLWSRLPLGGTPAWRVSMFSASAAALAVGVLFLIARSIGQTRGVAATAALALATSRTFWSQATIAEVYALAALIQALLLLALLRWRAGRWPLWRAGVLFGLGLAHHRTIALMAPGALLFVLLSHPHRRDRREAALSPPSAASAVTKKNLAGALAAALAGCLLYLYLPLRAPPWLDSWRTFARHVAGSDALAVWLTIEAPWRLALEHLRDLVVRLIWPQFFPIGALLALLGLARVWWHTPDRGNGDRALAALLASGYLLTVLFCVLFFVQDVEVFMIAAHLIAALLIGEGTMLLIAATKDQGRKTKVARGRSLVVGGWWLVGLSLLLLPALLFAHNLPAIRAAHMPVSELAARATLAQPLPRDALLLIDWDAVEPLRYLQEIEGVRPDLEVRPLNDDVARRDVDTALAAGRAAYLLHALPGLGLAQRPEGRLWRVGHQAIELRADTPADQRWRDGIVLAGYTLRAGPYHPGEIVPVTLAWRPEAPPQGGYTLFVHLVGPDGTPWGQQDRPPAPAPTDQWRPGAHVVDLYGPTLRLDAPPGRYDVVIGWYAFPSLDRLPLASGAADSYTLGQIEVVPLHL